MDLNEGNGFNPSNGIFIAPAAGVCVFDLDHEDRKGNTAYISLVVNGKRKSLNYCNDNDCIKDISGV